MSVSLIAVGLALWIKTGYYTMFLVQLACLIGQAVTPSLVGGQFLMQALNIFEVVILNDAFNAVLIIYSLEK